VSGFPKKAVVLAAGLGTRLRPLTFERPKPLMPLRGVPLLERALRLLEGWGVEEIAVNAHWRPERIEAFLERREGPGRKLPGSATTKAATRVSREPEILGTGGALRPLRDFLGDAPFWVVNSDIVAEGLSAAPFLAAFEEGEAFAAAWLEPKKGPRTVEADRRGRITCYRSPTPGVPGTFTFCGLQLLSPRVFDYLPDRPFCTLVEAYERAMERGVFVRGVTVKGSRWDDAGTVEAYLRLHGRRSEVRGQRSEVRGRRSEVRGQRAGGGGRISDLWPPTSDLWVSEGAEVAPDARGSRSVVYGGAKVLPGSVLKACVIAGGSVGGRLTGVVCVPAAEAGDDALPEALAALGWRPEETAAAFLGARGSDRTFWRLYRGGDSAVYIRHTEARAENARYGGHARLLAAAGVPVPRVLAELPERRCLVMEDWGDDSLQARMERTGRTSNVQRPMSNTQRLTLNVQRSMFNGERAVRWYLPVVRALARLHVEGTRRVAALGVALEPPFDEKLYAWERGLFEEHLLRGRYGFDALPAEAARELREIAGRLGSARQVALHRDCQSSNILFRGKAFAFIDFQGLRLGPAAYDLASLLYDPYVKLSFSFRARLAEAYGTCHAGLAADAALLHEGAVQRLVQALGAFGRLASVGQAGFTRHILPALENLLEAADTCGLDAVGGLAEELIAREKCVSA
jgi:NDP-sugar pyrophosphorylase family protein/aminoglycoside/choline kinase family phosphotransferase